MTTIIHGEDITKSRKYFIEQRQQYHDAVAVNGVTITLTEVMQLFEGNDLFATEKHIFIEELFSKRKKSKETEQIIQLIKQNHSDATIFLWESKDLSAALLKQWNNATMKQFKLPQIVFTFLEALKPNNGKALIHLFYEALRDEETQFVFSMMVRQLRLLLYFAGANNLPAHSGLSSGSKTSREDHVHPQIEEVKRMSPWQKSKLEKQATVFSIDQLKNAYAKLYQIECGVKTGLLHLPLEQAIDFFLIEL